MMSGMLVRLLRLSQRWMTACISGTMFTFREPVSINNARSLPNIRNIKGCS